MSIHKNIIKLASPDSVLPVKDLPGYYVTSGGQIISTRVRRKGTLIPDKPRFLSPMKGAKGYLVVYISIAPRQRYIHRLVIETFHGPPPPNAECRHLDGNKLNNRADNLAWGTSKENAQDRMKHGTHFPGGFRGSESPLSKLTESDVRQIRQLLTSGKTQREIARPFNVHPQTISNIKRGISWKWLK